MTPTATSARQGTRARDAAASKNRAAANMGRRQAVQRAGSPKQGAGQSGQARYVDVEGRRLRLTNLDKVLYPRSGFTKAAVIDYYARIAPSLLPQLEGRAISLKRYPDGVEATPFYQKQAPDHRPAWLRTIDVPSQTRGSAIQYCTASDLPSLVWLANLGNLEFHTFLHKADLDRPTQIVLDLDPGPRQTLLDCARLALDLEAYLLHLGLKSFPKVSGGKGLHIHVPLNGNSTYAETGTFARLTAELFERRRPGVVANMLRSLRGDNILLDWSQNNPHKTTVAPYSLRGQSRPTVACPVHWDELVDARRAASLSFTPSQALARVEEQGDLLAPLLTLRQRLPGAKRAPGETAASESVPARRRPAKRAAATSTGRPARQAHNRRKVAQARQRGHGRQVRHAR